MLIEFNHVYGINQLKGLGECKELNQLVCFVDIKAMPTLIPTDINPRTQDTDNKVCEKIKETLITQDGTFEFRNNGITIVCEDVTVNDNGTLTVRVNNHPLQGIANGAHTYKCILEANEKEDNDYNTGRVMVRFIYGPENIRNQYALDFCISLNTQNKVERSSKVDKIGAYDFIKEELQNEVFKDRIVYQENGNGNINIGSILELINMFNPRSFVKHIKETILQYSPTSKKNLSSGCVENFEQEYKVHGNTTENHYYAARYIIKDIIALYDLIEFNLADWTRVYYPNYESIRYRTAPRSKSFSQMKSGKTKYYGQPKPIYSPIEFVKPILFGLRNFLTEDEQGYFRWEINPFDFLSATNGAELTNIMFKAYEKDGNKCIGATSTNATCWYDINNYCLAYYDAVINNGKKVED